MGLSMKETKDIIAVAITVLIIAVVAYFGAGAFFDLVGNIYHWLDNFIWAFFAGIIAFFIAIWLVTIMIAITVWCVVLVLALISGIISVFIKIKGSYGNKL